MNKQRRQELLDVADYFDDAVDKVEEIRDEEQDAFDSLPEGFQNSSRGDAMLTAIDQMDDLVNKIEFMKSEILKEIGKI